MKKMFFMSLLLVSQLTWSGVLPKEKGRNVVKAIAQAFKESKLTCTLDQKPTSRDFNWKYFDYDSERTTSFEVSINDSGAQPFISVTRNSLYRFETYEEVMIVTTNPNQTDIVELSLTSSRTQKEQKNVGTITEPRFEEVIVRSETTLFICR